MSSGNVSLFNVWYENKEETQEVEEKKKVDLNEIVDDLINTLIEDKPQLINDTENGTISKMALEKEIIDYINGKQIKLAKTKYSELIKKVYDYLFGYYLLQPLIDDKDISDIEVINKDTVKIKKLNKRYNSEVKFANDKSYETFVNYVCIKNGGLLSRKNAIQKLSDTTSSDKFNLRINVTSVPICTGSSVIVIRKLPKDKYDMNKLRELGMMNEEIQHYLENIIQNKINILVCGKGGSGKTTLMNAALEIIPEDESTLVVQESEELFSKKGKDIIFQKVKYKTGESEIQYLLTDLTINAMLMDLDRIVIGEVKGAESMEIINAVYSGHVGWWSLHAPNSKTALNKMVQLMKYSNTDLSRNELMEMLSQVDLILFLKDFKIKEVTEVQGYDHNNNEIIYNPVFKYKNGQFNKLNGSCDRMLEKLNDV